MREFLLGALGVALAYPVIWYQMSPPAPPHVVPAVAARPPAPRKPASQEAVLREMTRQVVQESVPAAERKLDLPRIEEPEGPAVAAPRAPIMPLPEALPHTINQMSELQRLARDPQQLAERVQALDEGSADVAELKAFAEMFVALPPNRMDHEVVRPSASSGRSGSRLSPGSRR